MNRETFERFHRRLAGTSQYWYATHERKPLFWRDSVKRQSWLSRWLMRLAYWIDGVKWLA